MRIRACADVNGATLKATTVLAMLNWQGVKPSYSRPRASDDNAFVESMFRTAKYRPEYPTGGFADLDIARQWAASFVHWYNHDHRHSGIRYVSPAQRHVGADRAILQQRHELYCQARERNSRRWSGNTRNWTPIGAVTLNPERDAVVKASNNSLDMHRPPVASVQVPADTLRVPGTKRFASLHPSPPSSARLRIGQALSMPAREQAWTAHPRATAPASMHSPQSRVIPLPPPRSQAATSVRLLCP